jgi:hypothetical protein
MFRVSQEEKRRRTIITVDGELSGDQTEVVETCCGQAMAQVKPVRLILRDVSTVDRAGCALLGRLASKGVSILAQGVYTSYLVASLRPGGKGAPTAAIDAATPDRRSRRLRPRPPRA